VLEEFGNLVKQAAISLSHTVDFEGRLLRQPMPYLGLADGYLACDFPKPSGILDGTEL
jgi:hypothetical protein